MCCIRPLAESYDVDDQKPNFLKINVGRQQHYYLIIHQMDTTPGIFWFNNGSVTCRWVTIWHKV